MFHLISNNATGEVIVGKLPPPARDGWTPHEIEEIPDGSGKLKWLAGALVRVPVPIPVPTELPTWRIRAICKLTPYGATNLGHAVDALIATLDDPIKTVADQVWNRGNTIARNSSIVAQLAAALSLSGEQVDALFIQAATLPS